MNSNWRIKLDKHTISNIHKNPFVNDDSEKKLPDFIFTDLSENIKWKWDLLRLYIYIYHNSIFSKFNRNFLYINTIVRISNLPSAASYLLTSFGLTNPQSSIILSIYYWLSWNMNNDVDIFRIRGGTEI